MNETEELLDGIQRAQDELDAIVSAWNRVMLKAMCAAANERAKIVAFLRDEALIMAATVQAQNTLLEAAAKIEAGRHLK